MIPWREGHLNRISALFSGNGKAVRTEGTVKHQAWPGHLPGLLFWYVEPGRPGGCVAGFFITFEGIDKSGKTTQARLLAEQLGKVRQVVLTREPGGTELGREIRSLVLDWRSGAGVMPTTEMLLFAADRAQHVAELIRPSLDAGSVVISDRFADSTLAYQGYGRGMDLDRLRSVQEVATCGLRPDLTILIDVDPATARTRAGDRAADRMEDGSDRFFERVRNGFLKLWQDEPERILRADGRLPAEVLSKQIYTETCRRMERLGFGR